MKKKLGKACNAHIRKHSKTTYDLIIRNGTIVSGTKENRYVADIGIINNKIVEIKNHLSDGIHVIDAEGLIVSPGFIDMHTHSDISFVQNETCDSKLYQGVTTEIAGCCGFSFYPSPEIGMERLKKYIEEDDYIDFVSKSLNEFIAKTKDYKMTVNWGTYIGHNALRVSVVGFDNVKATETELEEMKEILNRELELGAFGLSLGIAYAPGMFASIEEYIELAKVVEKHNKIVTAHIRNENDHLFESIEEMIEIGRQSKAHVHISHLKLGFGSWHKTEKLFKLIENARAEGIHITTEQYLYSASSTGLSAVLPNWIHDGGTEKILERFKHERQTVIKSIEKSNSYQMGLDRVIVVSTQGFMPEADGKSIREISKLLNKSEAETVIFLLEHTNCSIPTIRFSMVDEDVYEIMKREDCAVISDGSAYSLDEKKIKGNPHPRNYGTYPRFLKLNKDKGFMSLEKAIYKMTCLPASYLNITDRGVIKIGNYADITIFDYNSIEDTATFEHAVSKPNGIKYVIVNGKIAINKGELTTERIGEILLKTP